MKKSPLVSIIIPLHNAEKYIEKSIKSALNQTWPNKEIIVIDDGSTDNSLTIAKQFNTNILKIFTQSNKGASAARNVGLREATGEYIQFLDADDVLSDNKIASQMESLSDFPGYIGLCATVHFDDGDDHLSAAKIHEWYAEGSDDTADFLIKLYGGALIGPTYGGMIQPNAWLTPRHLIEKAGLWNEELSLDDDGEFFCRLLLAADGIKYTKNGANYYRKFTGRDSLSAQKNRAACNSIMQSTLLKAKYLITKTDDVRAKIALARLFWDNAINFYPAFPQLSAKAEKLAREYDPAQKPYLYKNYLLNCISSLAGWKRMRLFSQWRKKWNKNKAL